MTHTNDSHRPRRTRRRLTAFVVFCARRCRALDARHDGKVTIDELIKAANGALHGCGA